MNVYINLHIDVQYNYILFLSMWDVPNLFFTHANQRRHNCNLSGLTWNDHLCLGLNQTLFFNNKKAQIRPATVWLPGTQQNVILKESLWSFLCYGMNKLPVSILTFYFFSIIISASTILIVGYDNF